VRHIDVIAVVAVLAATGCHVDPPLPPVPSCGEAAAHVDALHHADGAYARGVRATLERRCEVDHWSERTRTCIADEATLDGNHKCRDTLTIPQRTQLDAALAALATPTVSARPLADAECPPTVVEECAAVCDALGRVAQCPGMPNARVVMQAWIHALAMVGTQPIDTQRRMCLAQLQSMQFAARCTRP
jgi:hypothetical protein